MTDWDDRDDYTEPDDDDWYDPADDDYREPDPEDSEIARAYEEHYEHLDQVHGGGECDCRPSLAARLRWRAADLWHRAGNTRARARNAARSPLTVRAGRIEVTVRLHADRPCSACGGKGWMYTLDRGRPDDRPAGYNGVSLCGCGSSTARLAESRQMMRRTDREPPF